MQKRLPRRHALAASFFSWAFPSWAFSSLALGSPAFAHVKWFLSRSEEELLRQPKPDIFTRPCLSNELPCLVAMVALALSTWLGLKFRRCKFNMVLSKLSEKREAELNLFIGIMTGLSFIYCGFAKFLCAPDFIICSHCPQWLPYAEYAIGISLLFGIFARVGGVALVALLVFTFIKHTVADCLDLLPLYGVGFYFLFVGRGKYSIDALIKIDGDSGATATAVGYLCLRLAMGLGLVILGIDEKLVNPQLALDVLKFRPELDFLRYEHMSAPLFVLCAGLGELLVGLLIVIGSFPRLAAAGVFAIFAATTLVFGTSELFGHLAYYGILAQILCKGHGTVPQKAEIRELFASLLKQLQLRLLPQFSVR
jgi:uncharacterized membrane protein YphA (DoxX/SURF4 family)